MRFCVLFVAIALVLTAEATKPTAKVVNSKCKDVVKGDYVETVCTDTVEETTYKNEVIPGKTEVVEEIIPGKTTVETTEEIIEDGSTTTSSSDASAKIAVEASCDNTMTFYADGKKYSSKWDNNWTKLSKFNINANTQVVAIKCHDYGVIGGIIAKIGNRVTDGSWKCSRRRQSGWNKPNFDDSNWKKANVVKDKAWGVLPKFKGRRPQWIWSGNHVTPKSGKVDVYCRYRLKGRRRRPTRIIRDGRHSGAAWIRLRKQCNRRRGYRWVGRKCRRRSKSWWTRFWRRRASVCNKRKGYLWRHRRCVRRRRSGRGKAYWRRLRRRCNKRRGYLWKRRRCVRRRRSGRGKAYWRRLRRSCRKRRGYIWRRRRCVRRRRSGRGKAYWRRLRRSCRKRRGYIWRRRRCVRRRRSGRGKAYWRRLSRSCRKRRGYIWRRRRCVRRRRSGRGKAYWRRLRRTCRKRRGYVWRRRRCVRRRRSGRGKAYWRRMRRNCRKRRGYFWVGRRCVRKPRKSGNSATLRIRKRACRKRGKPWRWIRGMCARLRHAGFGARKRRCIRNGGRWRGRICILGRRSRDVRGSTKECSSCNFFRYMKRILSEAMNDCN